MSSASSLSIWNNFFISAGIPDSVAHDYAVTFSQHRIRIDMLRDINKEILLDMGIKAMGDIIAILRHAKELYTQDELRGAFHMTPNTAAPTSLRPNIVNSRLISVNTEPQHQRVAPVQSAKTGLSLSSATGSKIHSRLGLSGSNGILSVGDKVTSLNNNQATLSTNKRPTSTTSTSLSKRLRSEPGHGSGIELPEKTLTVHYPSSSAIARAHQRLQAAPGSSSIKTNSDTTQASISIKSRLGQVAAPSGRVYSSPKDHSNGDAKDNDHTFTYKNRPKGEGHDFRRNDSRAREPPSRERTQHSSGRLKSTVFHRLGDPAR